MQGNDKGIQVGSDLSKVREKKEVQLLEVGSVL